MDIEIIPEGKQKNKTASQEPYKDIDSETLPTFDTSSQPHKNNEFFSWIKKNRLTSGLIGGTSFLFIAIIIFQLQAPAPAKNIIEVRNFEDCVNNKGSILEGTNPRECYLKQKKFVEEKTNVVTPEPPKEAPIIEDKITEQTYTNILFPNFSVDYTSDWKKTEENTETGSTLLLQKEGITLNYNIGLIDIFGDQGGQCTNNTFLFLSLENSDWYRIRSNNGDRYYSSRLILKNQGTPDTDPISLGDTEKAKTEWVEVAPVPIGVYEACLIGTTDISSITNSSIPASLDTNTGFKSGLITIRISGISDSNKNALKEADKIVASTEI